MLIPPPAWRPTNASYHAAVTHWSNSMLAEFRDSPARAHALYVTGDLEREPPSPQMVVGSAVHLLLLEPDTVSRRIYVAECDARTAKIYKDSVRDRPDQLVLTRKEWETAEGAAGSILAGGTAAARVARSLLAAREGCYSEYAFQWEDELGVPCKLMADRLLEVPWSTVPVCPDLKTNSDPWALLANERGEIYKAGYHAQAALYRRGLTRLLGGIVPRHILVAVRNEKPFEVYVRELSEGVLAKGLEVVESDLKALARCLAGAPWESAEETLESGEIPFVLPPPWERR